MFKILICADGKGESSSRMNRSEALAVLHELFTVLQETLLIGCVSLDSKETTFLRGSNGFEIKIKCELDVRSRKCMEPILEKHNLGIKEDEGFIILYSEIGQPFAAASNSG
jgi:hypothetical protein